MDAASIIQASNIARMQTEEQLKIEQDMLRFRAKIAESRFKRGCVIVVAAKRPDRFTSLSEGLPVIDWARKTPLPAGTVVCDTNGNTAVIERRGGKDVVGQTAYTGNRELINEAKKRANAQYRVPEIN